MLLNVGVADYGVMGTSDWTTDSFQKGMEGGQRLERQAGSCIREMRSIRVFISLVSSMSMSTKRTGRVDGRVALALTLTSAPRDVNVMYRGQLDLQLGPINCHTAGTVAGTDSGHGRYDEGICGRSAESEWEQHTHKDRPRQGKV